MSYTRHRHFIIRSGPHLERALAIHASNVATADAWDAFCKRYDVLPGRQTSSTFPRPIAKPVPDKPGFLHIPPNWRQLRGGNTLALIKSKAGRLIEQEIADLPKISNYEQALDKPIRDMDFVIGSEGGRMTISHLTACIYLDRLTKTRVLRVHAPATKETEHLPAPEGAEELLPWEWEKYKFEQNQLPEV